MERRDGWRQEGKRYDKFRKLEQDLRSPTFGLAWGFYSKFDRKGNTPVGTNNKVI